MGKQKAQALAREERLTWADLLALVNAGPPDDEPSSVNRALSIGYCRDLYRKVIAEREASHVPQAWRVDVYIHQAGAVKPSKDFLIVTNILRDFHP